MLFYLFLFEQQNVSRPACLLNYIHIVNHTQIDLHLKLCIKSFCSLRNCFYIDEPKYKAFYLKCTHWAEEEVNMNATLEAPPPHLSPAAHGVTSLADSARVPPSCYRRKPLIRPPGVANRQL